MSSVAIALALLAACNAVLGVEPTEVVPPPTLTTNCGEITVVATNQHNVGEMVGDDQAVYWINQSDGTVMQLRDTALTMIAEKQNVLSSIALTRDRVFWTSDLGVRSWLRTGTGDPFPIEKTPLFAIAADLENIYTTDNSVDGGVVRISLADGGAQTTLVAHLDNPQGIAVGTSTVYYATAGGGGTLQSVPMDGGPPLTLVNPANVVRLFVREPFVYWAADGANEAFRYDLGKPDGGVQSIASGGSVNGIVADDQFAYVSSGHTGERDGVLVRRPSQGGDGSGTTTCAMALAHPGPMAIDASYVYFISKGGPIGISGDTVYRLKKQK